MIESLCTGDPRELGFAQGIALRDKIHSARRTLSQLIAFRARQPWWLPYRWYRRISESKARRFVQAAFVDERIHARQRIQGIAEGAELPLRAICLMNALEPVLSSVADCTASPSACSAVAIRGRRSATGEPVLARNFDYLPLAQPFYTIRDVRPTRGSRSLEFTAAPLAGAVDGLNEAGLCIAYDYAFPKDRPPRPAPPISIAIAEALQQCTTVQQAADWISAQPRWGGGLLMLVDAQGDMGSLELSNTRTHLRRPAPGEDVLFHSNAYCDRAMREVQIAGDAVYTDRAPKPLRGRRLHRSSEMRDQRFAQLLAGDRPLDPQALARLMADHGPDDEPSDYTPCVHGDYWQTTACLQFLPQSRRMRVAYATACQAEYETLEI